jgi:copper chaperone CopZ
MDFNATVDLILKDLNEAREIIDDLKNYPGVPAIQVELAKSKCKSAGEVIALLKTVKHEQTRKVPEEKHAAPVIEIEEDVRQAERPAESVTVGDSFGFTGRVNEQMGSLMDDEHVSDMMKTKPLSNLADAIGVNDKFLFIREIFDGSPERYSQAIERLNGASSFPDAKEVLKSYTGERRENEVLKQLLALVKRKFNADE